MVNLAVVKEKLVGRDVTDVSIGYSTIRLFSETELDVGQIGYSVDASGNSLSGNNVGDWENSWLVIGYDELCGDPIFTDLDLDGFPVFTAMNGQGRWDAILISDSLESFFKCLEIMRRISTGRENPQLLENNPVRDVDKKNAVDSIRRLNPNAYIEFWESLITAD